MTIDPEQFIQVTTHAHRIVTVLPRARRIRYALLHRSGVDFVAVMVPEGVLDDPLERAQAEARAYLVFHTPAVLVSLMHHRIHGRADVVRMLSGVDVARLRWRLYSLAA